MKRAFDVMLRHSPVWLCCALALTGAVRDGKASGFVGYYAPSNFTFANIGAGGSTANGSRDFPDFATLVLTGTNDGSGIPGWSDLTIPAEDGGVLPVQL